MAVGEVLFQGAQDLWASAKSWASDEEKVDHAPDVVARKPAEVLAFRGLERVKAAVTQEVLANRCWEVLTFDVLAEMSENGYLIERKERERLIAFDKQLKLVEWSQVTQDKAQKQQEFWGQTVMMPLTMLGTVAPGYIVTEGTSNFLQGLPGVGGWVPNWADANLRNEHIKALRSMTQAGPQMLMQKVQIDQATAQMDTYGGQVRERREGTKGEMGGGAKSQLKDDRKKTQETQQGIAQTLRAMTQQIWAQ